MNLHLIGVENDDGSPVTHEQKCDIAVALKGLVKVRYGGTLDDMIEFTEKVKKLEEQGLDDKKRREARLANSS